MPIYVYKREDGSIFEIEQKITEPTLQIDPKTGQKVKRLLQPPAVHFKGSGFYNTDYKNK